MSSADYYLYTRHVDTLSFYIERVPSDHHASFHLCFVICDGGGPEKARTYVPGESDVVVNSSSEPHPYDVIDIHNRGAPQQVLQFPGDSPCDDLEAGWTARQAEDDGDFKADIDFGKDMDYNLALTRNVCTSLLGPTAVADDKTEDVIARKNQMTEFRF